MSELKPLRECPLCGGEVVSRASLIEYIPVIECLECGAMTAFKSSKSYEAWKAGTLHGFLRDSWNRRANYGD